MRAAAEAKSKKCSESAKCRTARNISSQTIPAKKANAANTANATLPKPKAVAETVMVSSAYNFYTFSCRYRQKYVSLCGDLMKELADRRKI